MSQVLKYLLVLLAFTGLCVPDTFAKGLTGVVSDFNGDGIVDQAFGDCNGKDVTCRVQVRLSGQPTPAFLETAVFPQPGLQLVVNDINRDGKIDIVLMSLSRASLTVWINDGKGRFHRSRRRHFIVHPGHDDLSRPITGDAARQAVYAGRLVLFPPESNWKAEAESSLLLVFASYHRLNLPERAHTAPRSPPQSI